MCNVFPAVAKADTVSSQSASKCNFNGLGGRVLRMCYFFPTSAKADTVSSVSHYPSAIPMFYEDVS
jgi:hypothetical protein